MMAGVVRIDLTGAWSNVPRILERLRELPKVAAQAIGQQAHLYRAEVVKEFNAQGATYAGGWKPLAARTLAARKAMRFRGTKALLHTGDLRASVKVVQLDAEAWFVGVHRTARGDDGRTLENVGRTHEFGDPDRRIPALPFLFPAWEALRGTYADNIVRIIVSRIGR